MANVGLLEDNSRIARLCSTMLEYSGHRVMLYPHPQQCIDALRRPLVTYESRNPASRFSTHSHLPIDILILDLQLPEISGIEVLHFLQSDPCTRTLPLIFCTASTPSEIARALHIAPYATVLEKPFKLQALVAAVNKTLGAGEQ